MADHECSLAHAWQNPGIAATSYQRAAPQQIATEWLGEPLRRSATNLLNRKA